MDRKLHLSRSETSYDQKSLFSTLSNCVSRFCSLVRLGTSRAQRYCREQGRQGEKGRAGTPPLRRFGKSGGKTFGETYPPAYAGGKCSFYLHRGQGRHVMGYIREIPEGPVVLAGNLEYEPRAGQGSALDLSWGHYQSDV